MSRVRELPETSTSIPERSPELGRSIGADSIAQIGSVSNPTIVGLSVGLGFAVVGLALVGGFIYLLYRVR